MEKDGLLLTLAVQSSPLGLEHGGNLTGHSRDPGQSQSQCCVCLPSPSSLLYSGY